MPNRGQPFGGNAWLTDRACAGLTWIDDPGIGYYPVTSFPYTADYFASYAARADTDMGARLTAFRAEFVARHWRGPLLDVGIGCGQFVQSRPLTSGYDVNPAGIAWLLDRGLFVDPYRTMVQAAAFWDSLEHIANPAPLLARVTDFVFVSIPIFQDLAHVLRSKHYKPDEHFLYATDRGFRAFMDAHGWRCVDSDDTETTLGREDIRSYAFVRVRSGP